MDRPRIEAHPPVSQWPSLAREWFQRNHQSVTLFGRSLRDWRDETRRALGLPTDVPVVMTGHQADFWHPGILVKDFLNEALANRISGEAVHLVVDQDDNEPDEIIVPVRDDDGELCETNVRLFDAETAEPILSRRAQRPRDVNAPDESAIDTVRTAIQLMRRALAFHANAQDLAAQVASAVNDVQARWITPPTLVFVSSFTDTDLWHALLRAMANDPRRVARQYNSAVRAVPEAGLNELLMTDDAVELPLWRIGADGKRHRAFARDLESDDRLLPRALLMTAFVRLAACDLFIHGTGGGVYDRSTEQWMRDWLDVELAPIVSATTTMYLPFVDSASPSLDEAREVYRHAWHDPFPLGDRAISDEKAAMLREIDARRRGSRDRRDAFFTMHERLAREREAQGALMEGRRANVLLAERADRERAIRERRTWAFLLYPDHMITALRDASRAALVDRAASPTT